MTLARIAARLGLSVTTVSRALAGYGDVAADTRRRVADEARRIGYQPNPIARRLQSGRTDAVGIVLPTAPGQFDDPFFLRLLAVVGPLLRDAGLDMLVTTARPGAEEMEAYRHLVEGRRVDGMLLARTRVRDPRIAYLQQQGMPFAAHGRSITRTPFAHVDVDSEAAFEDATRRLIALGHTRIGLVGAPADYMFARLRHAGWRKALAAAGLPARHHEAAEPTEENGALIARRMLAPATAPTALLCATDRLAVGALHALSLAGLRAGRDVSVIGYDDLPQATYTDPPLTSIAQPIDRAAALLVEMLLALRDGASPATLHHVLPARLIPRGSDGPAPLRRAATTKKTQGGIHDTETHAS
ncbi:MAG: substrate-binding domain-containing protein [Rhodospirillales bacterium]|nr:substrate-binding domain-containing protein [Rhodospirillales bacterium]